jgi:hypothetical protein
MRRMESPFILSSLIHAPASVLSHPPTLPPQALTRPPRAAAAVEAAAPPPPPPSPPEPPIITELRARSAANKAANDAERLANYYKRNADALRVLLDRGGARTLDPELRAKIQKWLDDNGV